MSRFPRLMVAAAFLGVVVGCDAADNDYLPPADNAAAVNVDEPDQPARPRDTDERQPD